MPIKCCKNCFPPERYIGCHGKCDRYIKEKMEWEKEKARMKENEPVVITNYDFEEIAFARCKCHKRRKRN